MHFLKYYKAKRLKNMILYDLHVLIIMILYVYTCLKGSFEKLSLK